MGTSCNGNILAFQGEVRGSIPRVQYRRALSLRAPSDGGAVVGYTVNTQKSTLVHIGEFEILPLLTPQGNRRCLICVANERAGTHHHARARHTPHHAPGLPEGSDHRHQEPRPHPAVTGAWARGVMVTFQPSKLTPQGSIPCVQSWTGIAAESAGCAVLGYIRGGRGCAYWESR
jgi:hypothetical protein